MTVFVAYGCTCANTKNCLGVTYIAVILAMLEQCTQTDYDLCASALAAKCKQPNQLYFTRLDAGFRLAKIAMKVWHH